MKKPIRPLDVALLAVVTTTAGAVYPRLPATGLTIAVVVGFVVLVLGMTRALERGAVAIGIARPHRAQVIDFASARRAHLQRQRVRERSIVRKHATPGSAASDQCVPARVRTRRT
jgi:hypothetical protein